MNRARQLRVPGLVSLLLVLILVLTSVADAAPPTAEGKAAAPSPGLTAGVHARRQAAPTLHQLSTETSRVNIPARTAPSDTPAIAISTFSINYLPAGTTFYSWSCQTWPADAITAFNAAADVWGTLLKSSVPITVDVCWAPLSPGQASGAWPYGYSGGYPQLPRQDTWYPDALANALAGTDLNPTTPDIEAVFGSYPNWYFGTDGNPGPGLYDLMTNVLRELGYGLGYEASLGVASGLGSWGFGWAPTLPNVYDRFVVNGSGQLLIGGFANNSAQLAAQLQSNNVYFDGPQAKAANGGNRPKLYAPSPWQKIAYISYLDPVYDGTANALMTITLAQQEVVHDPGPMGLAVLNDLGWNGPPTVTGASPASGNVGASVAISGTNLAGATSVTFNGVSASFSSFSAAEITATVPLGATTGQVSVTTPNGTGTSAAPFTITAAAPPQVSFLGAPARIVDTRVRSGYQGSGQAMLGAPSPQRFQLAGKGGVPANATAVLVNLTAVGYSADGWISAWPACTPWPGTSSLNFDNVENAIANFAVVKLGSASSGAGCQGAISATGNAGTNVIVDAVGYLFSTTDDQVVLLNAPQRMVDTRAGSGKLGAGTQIPVNPGSSRFKLADGAAIPVNATSVLVNLTAVGYRSNGWVAAYPACTTWSDTSNLNYDTDENAIANFAVVKLGDSSAGAGCQGAVDVTASSSTDFLADVIGYTVATASDQVLLLPSPKRFLDTRQPGSGGALQGGVPHCYSIADLNGVPADAHGVVLNLTAVGYAGDGWIAAYPNGEAWSGTSSVNFDTQENAIANTAVVRPGTGGQVCLLASGTTNAIIDVSGYLK